MDEATLRMEQATEAAAQAQARAISEQWKLQAQTNAQRAGDLYRGRMYEDAVHHARQAIGLDRGNINAYMIAAWSLERLGQSDAARECYGKQTALLRTAEYRTSVVHFLRVLQGMPNDDALLEGFRESLAENIPRWSYSPDCVTFIMALADRGLLEDARRLIERLNRANERIELHACMITITSRLGSPSAQGLRQYLRGVAVHRRTELLTSLSRLMGDGRFPPATIAALRREVRATYATWEPEISTEIATAAAEATEGKAREGAASLAWMVGVGCFVVLSPILGSLMIRRDVPWPFFVLFTAIAAALVARQARLAFLRGKLQAQEVEGRWEAERKAWRPALESLEAPGQTTERGTTHGRRRGDAIRW